MDTHISPAPTDEEEKGSTYLDRMMVRRDQRTTFVRMAEVQWIESSGNYVILHVGRERERESG